MKAQQGERATDPKVLRRSDPPERKGLQEAQTSVIRDFASSEAASPLHGMGRKRPARRTDEHRKTDPVKTRPNATESRAAPFAARQGG